MPKRNDNSITAGRGGIQGEDNLDNVGEELDEDRDQSDYIKELYNKVQELQDKIEELENHQHLGEDGSKELGPHTELNGKEVSIYGAGKVVDASDFNEAVVVPLRIFDSQKADKQKRLAGNAIYILGNKGEPDEQDTAVLTVGMQDEEADEKPSNRRSFDDASSAQLEIINLPQTPPSISGSTSFPSYAFLRAMRAPQIKGYGTITNGGTTITDTSADFKVPDEDGYSNTALFGTITIYDENRTGIEQKVITDISSQSFTVDTPWETESGTYYYRVNIPVFLGSAGMPFSRAYIRDDLRLGAGTSSGPRVKYIKWGAVDPEGNITANKGSLYLRSDGSLYVKKANDQQATGWVKLMETTATFEDLTVNNNLDVGNQLSVSGGTLLSGDLSAQGNSFFESDVFMNNLPTSDPAQAGQLWNDAGTLKVSSG